MKFMTQQIMINKHSEFRVLKSNFTGKWLPNKQAAVPEKFRHLLKERAVIHWLIISTLNKNFLEQTLKSYYHRRFKFSVGRYNSNIENHLFQQGVLGDFNSNSVVHTCNHVVYGTHCVICCLQYMSIRGMYSHFTDLIGHHAG